MVLGMVLISMAHFWIGEYPGFIISLIGAIIIGISSAIGEVSLLGFLKSCDSLLTAFGMGTGLAAFIPGFYYVLMRSAHITVYTVYMCFLPVPILFIVIFTIVDIKKAKFDKYNPKLEGKVLSDFADNMHLNCRTICYISKKIYRMMINIMMCYLLDYMILQCY